MKSIHRVSESRLSGEAVLIAHPPLPCEKNQETDPRTLDLLSEVLEKTRRRINELEKTGLAKNPHFEDTLRFYSMMTEDPELEMGLRTAILQEKVGLRDAIDRVFDRFETVLSEKNAYMSERRFDLIDFRGLMTEIVEERNLPPAPVLPDRAVIVMDQLLSTTLAPLDFSKIVAVLAQEGGAHSHAAILLKSLNLPVLFGKDLLQNIRSGDDLQIDIKGKKLWVNGKSKVPLSVPGQEKPRKTISPCDGNLKLSPCLSTPEEGLGLDPHSVEGIGLVRTETLMLAKRRFPDEEEQTEAFLPLVRHMGNQPVFFRLMDIEPDKLPPPGYSESFGAAFLIAHPEIAAGQMRVFLRMAQEHPLGIILPMVRTPEEVEILFGLFSEIRREFPVSPHPFRIGAMVETLEFARNLGALNHIDFVTVGTNDLVSELHQIDRLDGRFSPKWFHEADFLDTIRTIFGQTSLPVYVCGEAANDPRSVDLLREIGIRRFCPAVHRLGIFRDATEK